MISRAKNAAPTMNATTPRTCRVGRVVGHDAVESVPTFSVSATATHINCYIYIIIVYEYVRDMYGL